MLCDQAAVCFVTRPPYALWPGRRMLCDLAVVCFVTWPPYALWPGRRMLCDLAVVCFVTWPPYALWPGRRMLCDLAVVCFAHKRCRILCAEGRRMLCVTARGGPLWVVSGSRLAMTQSIRRPSAQNMRQLCAQKPLHNMNIQFHWQILRENTQQRRSFQCVEIGLHFGRFRLSMPSFKFGKLQHLF